MASWNFDTILLSEIRDKVEAVFGYRPCLWQLKVVRAILKRDKDVASIAATGSGKTLTFWMPLLFIPTGIQIVITPLNILGKQNVDSLAKVGISAITITAETATEENFQAIADGRHRAIVTNIETLMKPGGGFDKLWNDKDFMSKVISVVWDEAQCISKWGDFRPEYKTAGTLRHLIPKDIPFYITSATLPPDVLHDVMSTLGMRASQTEMFTRSNDRSNIHITVRKMRYPINSFKDLRFLIPKDWDGTTPLPYKFVIFFDNITESIAAARYLRSLVPIEARDKIKWFNSEMSPEFRAEESDNFNQGKTYGLTCTESFGMGIDMPNITLVIQWRATCDMCTLWQRFGRGARDPNCEAIALFLVEPMYFDQTKEEKAAWKAKKELAAANRKRKAAADPASLPPAKRARSDGRQQSGLGDVGPTVGPTATTSTMPDLRARFVASPPRRPIAASTAGPSTLPAQLPGQLDADEGSDTESDNDDDDTAALEDRREAYRKDKVTTKSTHKKPKKDGTELSPEMDDMINAGSEQRQIKCFRIPARLYFESDKAISDHRECRTDLPDGCPRCVAQPPRICCELCTPAHFENFAQVDLPLKEPTVPSRSRLGPYKAEASDMNLRDALHDFRRQATLARPNGRAILKNSGPGAVMSNEVLTRIMDCAHFFKIGSTEQLSRETRWASAAEYGVAVLDLIKLHRPIPEAPLPPPPTPLTARSNNDNAPETPLIRSRKCGKCGATDHIGSNKKFHPLPLSLPHANAPERLAPLLPANFHHGIDQNIAPGSEPPNQIDQNASTIALPRPIPRPAYGQYRPLASLPTLSTPLATGSSSASHTEPATPMAACFLPYSNSTQPLPPGTPSIFTSAPSHSSPVPPVFPVRSTLPPFHFYDY